MARVPVPWRRTWCAAPNRLMVHLAINEADADHDVVHWLAPVTDEEYGAAPATD